MKVPDAFRKKAGTLFFVEKKQMVLKNKRE